MQLFMHARHDGHHHPRQVERDGSPSNGGKP
jgi:hypothetical protein